MLARATLLLLSACATSCFVVTDLDRFNQAPANTSNFVDLRFTMRGMVSHVAEYVEYRVVDSSNTIQSRGILNPLGGVDTTFFAPGAIPKQNGPFRIDFFADHDRSGGYNDTATAFPDHSWRLPLDVNAADDSNTLAVVFDHNTSFVFLNDPAPREYGGPATVHLSNMGGFTGKRLEVRVADASVKRVVALFRTTVVSATFVATVPGMIDSGVTYAVEVYTDDGQATPGSIRAFRVQADSTKDGLDVAFDPATAPEVHDAPPP